MDQTKFKNLIPLYLGDELQTVEKQAFETFLKDNAQAQSELDAYRQSWDMLGELEDIKPEPAYISRFWTTLSQQRPWYKEVLKGLQESVFNRRLAPAFATAFLIVIIGFFSIRNFYQLQQADLNFASLNEDEMEMVEYIELAENYDIIEDIEFFEDFEIIEELDTYQSTRKLWTIKNTSVS